MGCGLKEAKDMVEKIPLTLKEEATKEDCEKLTKLFEPLGATIEIK